MERQHNFVVGSINGFAGRIGRMLRWGASAATDSTDRIQGRSCDQELCGKCKVERINSSRSCRTNNTTFTNISNSENKDVPSSSFVSGSESYKGRQNGWTEADQVDGLRFLAEKDMHSMYKHIPALGRRDVQLSGIQVHYYPEGGWGWIVVLIGFLVHCLTTGIQLAFGVLNLHMEPHFQTGKMNTIWVGVSCWSVSLGLSPLVTWVCQQQSIRLVAVMGGLLLNLSLLFASFGHQLHQVLLSYGLLFGAGCSVVRETSNLMLGQYFRERRDMAEMIVGCGPGVGIIVFSLLYKRAVGGLGWRHGLQALLGLLVLTFFVGLFYRSASLYHPQRDAIEHIKQKKQKVKPLNGKVKEKTKVAFLDFSILKKRAVQVILVSSGFSGLGIYTPIFYLAQHMQDEDEEEDSSSVSLIQCWLGIAFCAGCLSAGSIIVAKSTSCFISKRCLLRISIFGIGLSLLTLYSVKGFYGYVMFSWLYGIFLGCYTYVSKTFCYSIVKPKSFSRTWSLVQAVQSLPALLGIPITGYINESNDKTGYWVSLVFVCLGGLVLSFLPEDDEFVGVNPGGGFSNQENFPIEEMGGEQYDFPPLEVEGEQSFGSKVGHYLNADHPNLRHSVNMDMDSMWDNRPLQRSVILSQSEPEGLCHVGVNPSVHKEQATNPRPVSILKRKRDDSSDIMTPPPPPPAFRQIISPNQDVLVVDLITSTV